MKWARSCNSIPDLRGAGDTLVASAVSLKVHPARSAAVVQAPPRRGYHRLESLSADSSPLILQKRVMSGVFGGLAEKQLYSGSFAGGFAYLAGATPCTRRGRTASHPSS